MSTPLSLYLGTVSQQFMTYVGMFTAVVGLLGGLLNLIVFLSLKTFRESSCGFFLIVMSFVNMGQLFAGQLSRVLISGFGIDWTKSSLGYCKFRWYSLQVCAYISFTCLCFATIDQFMATSARVYWQQFNNIRLSRLLCIVCSVFWMIYGVPYLIFYNTVDLDESGNFSCVNTNPFFQQYHAYVNNILLCSGLPVAVSVLFGTLAYRNVRQIAYRTVPLVRRELDKQLTNMVLVQVAFSFFAVIPYMIMTVPPLSAAFTGTVDRRAQYNFVLNITLCLYYYHFAGPFYIYFCVSERFRAQLYYVLFGINGNRKTKKTLFVNQVEPQQA